MTIRNNPSETQIFFYVMTHTQYRLQYAPLLSFSLGVRSRNHANNNNNKLIRSQWEKKHTQETKNNTKDKLKVGCYCWEHFCQTCAIHNKKEVLFSS